MNRLASVCLAAALVALAAPAGAQEAAPAPFAPTMPAAPAVGAGIHEHDGFFLQIQPGVAYLDVTIDSFLPDMTLSGAGPGLDIAIGGTPVKNLVVFGEIMSQQASSPTLEMGGQEVETDDDVSVSLTNLGAGAAYYFGESNFFVSGALGIAGADFESAEGTASATGLGFRIGAGKEWWIGNQWGLGLGANFFGASLTDDKDEDTTVGAASFALNVSVTYH